MVCERAWSIVITPANIKFYQRQGVNVCIVGCSTSFYGTIINSIKVEPLRTSDVKKLEHECPKMQQKKTQDVKPKAPLKGTTAYPIFKFVEHVMDILDRHNKHGFYIVIEKCRVYHNAFVVDEIIKRGPRLLFIPPYSYFLHPIGGCWSKAKNK